MNDLSLQITKQARASTDEIDAVAWLLDPNLPPATRIVNLSARSESAALHAAAMVAARLQVAYGGRLAWLEKASLPAGPAPALLIVDRDLGVEDRARLVKWLDAGHSRRALIVARQAMPHREAITVVVA